MASQLPETDMGLGLGLVFGLVTLVAVVLTAVNGYTYALNDVASVRITAGIAFGVAMLTASVAVVLLHVYEA